MSCSDINWGDLAFVEGWLIYANDNDLLTKVEYARVAGQILGHKHIHNLAVSKAVEYPDHFTAFRTKRRILGEQYEPE